MEKYIPIDLATEHYLHLNQKLHAVEYAKICAEMAKPRYAPVPAAEALALYDRNELVLPDRVRVIWIHDVGRPSDNYLALQMATMEHEFGFRTSYNIRFLCALTPDFRAELDAVLALGHEIQYQYEDLVIAAGDMTEARASFRKNLAWLRSFYPDITVGFAHGVYKSGYFSGDIFKENGEWRPELITALGLRPLGELYYVIDRLSAELGLRFHYVGEDRYIGGDEFAAALREAKPGEVVMFLQHPTWWDVNYDLDELRRLVRKSAFFH